MRGGVSQGFLAVVRAGKLTTARTLASMLIVAGGVSATPQVALADNVYGAWLSPTQDNWPLIPIHALLTPDGRVLTFGTDGNGIQTGFFSYDVWDPEEGLSGGHITLPNTTLTDIFCAAQVILPDSGNVLIAGGDNWTGTSTNNIGNNNSVVYRYTNDTLSRGNNMKRARWYATTTTLMNGEIYIQGGSGGGGAMPEVRATNGSFRATGHREIPMAIPTTIPAISSHPMDASSGSILPEKCTTSRRQAPAH